MRTIAWCLLALLACSKPDHRAEPVTAAADPAAAALGWIEVDPAEPLGPQLVEQAAAAVRAGKKPHAYLHADWCGPCVEIAKTHDTDPKMRAAFAPTHIIAIDVDKVELAQIEAAGMSPNVLPVFYRLDGNGHPIGTSIDGSAWGDNVPDNMAPPLTAFFAN